MKNQLAALQNHIQSLLLSSPATEAIYWALFPTIVPCIILSLLYFVLCTSLPLLHVRYLPDGRFSTLQTDTHTHTAVLRRTQLVAQNTMHISAAEKMPCLIACTCLWPPVYSLCFALEERQLGQTLNSPCLTEITWKPFSFSPSRSDLF